MSAEIQLVFEITKPLEIKCYNNICIRSVTVRSARFTYISLFVHIIIFIHIHGALLKNYMLIYCEKKLIYILFFESLSLV